jgi:DNA end-binding protein Ku
MASRPIWRGQLRMALVSCPVALHSVLRDRGDLHFHLINPKTGNRVHSIMLDAGTDAEVPRQELVKGYEFEKDRYVLLEEQDFESARIESSSTIAIERFVAADAIDPMFFDTPYYMVPDGDAGADVYAVLREAIEKSGRIALSRVVIARRERAIAIRAVARGLMVHTLHEEGDAHDAATLFAAVPKARPDADMVKLAMQLIDRQAGRFDPAAMKDRYEARLREVIQAKLRGRGIKAVTAPERPAGGNVIDLMAALKRSLAAKPDAGRETREGGRRGGRSAANRAGAAPRRKVKRRAHA